LTASVFAQNSVFEENQLMRQEMEQKKQEMALLDYDTVEDKINRIESLASSTEDKDRAEAFALLKEVRADLTESRPVETRAVWLDDQALAKISSPMELRNLISWLNDLNVNIILPCVYFAGEAIYESDIVEQGLWYKLCFPDEDPLDIIIEEAHKYGMEVHPWVMVYGLQGNIEPFLDRLDLLDRNIKGEYNDTAHTDYFFSPAHPEARDHLLSIMLEVAKYDIDGIHLDNIRYKDGFGYGDYAVGLYQELFGRDPRELSMSSVYYNHFREFKAQFIASFVELVRVEMLRLDPHIMVSAATAPRTWGKNSLGQDWHNWIDNRSLHFVLPMSYSADPKEYKELLDFDLNRIGGRTYAYPGMTLYSFTPEVMAEEWLVGQNAPMTGQTLFSLLHIKTPYYQILRNGLFRDKAYPTFRDPANAAVIFLDWLSQRVEALGSYAGFSVEEKNLWLADFNRISDMIENFPGPKYGTRDLRAHVPEDNDYWNKVLEEINSLSAKTDKLEGPKKQRLKNDLSQLKSLITPLEYTTRPFDLVAITY